MLNIELNHLNKVMEDFFNVTGIKIVFYDSNRNLIASYPPEMCSFCTEVRKDEVLAEKCFDCDKIGFDVCDRTRDTYIYHCHMGLTEAISPICENGIIIGYMMFGQILDTNKINSLKAHFYNISGKHNIDPDILVRELDTMQVMNNKMISSAASMMEICTSYLWLNQIVSVRANSLRQHLEDYISNNLSSKLSVNSICRHLNISKSSLYKLSKNTYNIGISEYIKSRRLEKAKQLLKDDTLMIYEIASQVGIDDPNYFTKVFKKYVKLNPKEYRNKYLTK